MTIEEFQTGVQECTNYPLRASVPGFLRALLPLAQRDLQARARRAKQAGTMTIEEFQTGVQECTNYPLRASVPGFLRALLPLAQRDLQARARRAKQTPQQFIRSHEHLILESGGDGADIFQQQPPAETAVKRRASDP
ncbi:putative nervy [Operophtera brumata]|uniref:Putative nervy n=1 Tax=Operophtera brumata TaxID=104452 RepID=A0A0L7KQS1_OPEBR|nr:putative nervy [Operophtera brumata]